MSEHTHEGEPTLKTDIEAVVAFLEQWPFRPRILTSITVEGVKVTDTRTFTPETISEMMRWVMEENKTKNLYWMPNRALRPLTKKATKADIRGGVCLYADLDPRPGEPIDAERERSLRVLREYDPPGPPSFIIFSGGGHQGVWLLEDEVPINGDEAAAAEYERYNRFIELKLGADHCHNCDRILRLPGTVNWPDEKKRKKGRVPALARVVAGDWRRYCLDLFERAPVVDAKPNGSGEHVKIPENMLPLGSVDDLPSGVSQRVKSLIVQGFDEDDPNRYNSRSELVFYVSCELVRAGCDDDTVATVLLDKDFGISRHIHEQKKPKAYAYRQVRRARAAAKRNDFLLTDVGNGDRLVARHGQDMRYCYKWRSWLVWDGCRYRLDEDGAAVRKAKDTAGSIFNEAATVAAHDQERAKAVAKWAANSQQKQRIEAMLFMAHSELPVSTDDLDQDPMAFNLENGTLDLRTLTLRDHFRDDQITKLAPVKMDLDAKCPTWEAFLTLIYRGDTELIAFIQRAVGYSLTGDIGEQVPLLLHGDGANGKSTLLKTLLNLMGDYARPCEFRTLLMKDHDDAIRNDLAALCGLRLVTAVEVGRGKRLDETMVKTITGGDTITARFLHKELFDFTPQFKLWLAANAKPVIRGQDEAIWRRVLLVLHAVIIPLEQRDRDFAEKLKAELPGILNWAIEGLRAWREKGLMPPKSVMAATQAYRAEMDLLGGFIAARCVKNSALYEKTAVLYAEYTQWCSENGEDAVSKKTFGFLLNERGYGDDVKKIDGRPHRVRLGLGLLGPAQKELPIKPKEGGKSPY